jgi:hypothetical protein
MSKRANQKKINEINEIQSKFGGYRPDLILMYFAKRLDCLTKVLIALSGVLIVLTGVLIYLIIQGS